MDEKSLKELLLRVNEEFRKAYEEHQGYESALEQIRKKPYLSEEETLQEKELKKKKLVLKDKMYQMMAEYRKSI
jgi:hypothetical protein